MNDYCVYIHTFPNGKRYVGMTVQQPEKRWGSNGNGYRGQAYVYNAIKKYGWNNIKHEVVATGLTLDQAENMERSLISKYQTASKEYGYNIDLGGNHGGKFTEERKRQISEQQKGRKMSAEYCKQLSIRMKGHIVSEETRRKISEINKGHTVSEETRRKLSEANLRRGPEWREKLREMSRNRSPEINQKIARTLTGKKQSAETKEKRAQKLRGIKRSPEMIEKYKKAQSNRSDEWKKNHHEAVVKALGKRVQQFSIDGKFLCEYPSISEAARINGFKWSSIAAVARGDRKTHKGYLWKYVDKEETA